jgi:hypothetical protein
MTSLHRWKGGIVGSNPTEGTDVLRRADHTSKESYRLCKKDYETEEEARALQRAVEPLMNE